MGSFVSCFLALFLDGPAGAERPCRFGEELNCDEVSVILNKHTGPPAAPETTKRPSHQHPVGAFANDFPAGVIEPTLKQGVLLQALFLHRIIATLESSSIESHRYCHYFFIISSIFICYVFFFLASGGCVGGPGPLPGLFRP